jgi:hypothetical protein
LTATYFDNMDFSGRSITRVDPQVNFEWGNGSPDAAIAADTFSTRWTGQVQAQKSETYTFFVRADDGVRLWVNGQLLADGWKDQGPTEYSGSIALVAGQRYDIRMEYYENSLGAVAQLGWSSPTTPKQIIPQAQLYSTATPTASSTSVGSSTSVPVGTPVPAPLPPVVAPPTIDVTAPTVTVRTPVQEETYTWLRTASGKARDVGGSRVQAVYGYLMRHSDNYYWNGTDWTAQVASVLCKGKTVWNLALPELADGHYAFTAMAYDGAGNAGVSATVDFTVAAPTPTSGKR